MAIRELDEIWLKNFKEIVLNFSRKSIPPKRVFNSSLHIPYKTAFLQDIHRIYLDRIRSFLSEKDYQSVCLEIIIYLNARTLLISEKHRSILDAQRLKSRAWTATNLFDFNASIDLIDVKEYIPEILVLTSDLKFIDNLKFSMEYFEESVKLNKLSTSLPASGNSH